MEENKKDEQIIHLILSESEKLQKVLNETLLDKFIQLHNIPKDKNMFHAKQEIIAKRGYFLDVKKKYALRIVNAEGVPVEEIIERGLVTRRSDYPSLTKERMLTIFDLLLKKEKISFKNISRFVKETELEMRAFISKGEKCTSKPVSFSKEESSYKSIPFQVNGMKLWNLLEYRHFIPGTKGYLFRITGIDPYLAPRSIQTKLQQIDTFRWIVLPYDEERLPNYYQIDANWMLNFAWTDRVNELLKPILQNLNKTMREQVRSLTTF